MTPHIGQIIYDLKEKLGLQTKELEDAINKGEQTVYRLYDREVLDSLTLIQLSLLLKINLFSFFRNEPAIRDLPDPLVDELRSIIKQQEKDLNAKDALLTEKTTQIDRLEELRSLYQEQLKGKK